VAFSSKYTRALTFENFAGGSDDRMKREGKDGKGRGGGGGGGGVANKEMEPPRRVQKNPSFLQEHRDRYAEHNRNEFAHEFRGAKEETRR
jgi:hypothetical protein